MDNLSNIHWAKVITIHPKFWLLVQKIKFSHQKYLVVYVRKTLAQTLRVSILFLKDAYFLHICSPNKGTLILYYHLFATVYT